jgi:hypothetical protein
MCRYCWQAMASCIGEGRNQGPRRAGQSVLGAGLISLASSGALLYDNHMLVSCTAEIQSYTAQAKSPTCFCLACRMVRLIAASLVEVGHGRVTPQQFKKQLEAGARAALQVEAAPPHGLYLQKVRQQQPYRCVCTQDGASHVRLCTAHSADADLCAPCTHGWSF